MFKWFNKWFANKCKQAWEDARNQPEESIGNVIATTKSIGGRRIEQRGMNFTIYQANGGYVMEYSKYDERTDRHHTALHIITSDQDLGQGIAQIITLEMLRS